MISINFVKFSCLLYCKKSKYKTKNGEAMVNIAHRAREIINLLLSGFILF